VLPTLSAWDSHPAAVTQRSPSGTRRARQRLICARVRACGSGDSRRCRDAWVTSESGGE
jgi:hypothetical protein